MNDTEKCLQGFEYLEYLKKIIATEKSPFAKMILQENYISLQLQGFIVSIDFLILASFCNSREYLLNIGLNAKYSRNGSILIGKSKEYKNKTLGSLANLIKTKNYQMITGGDVFLSKLNQYIKRRNKITHSIIMELLTKEKVESDAKTVCRIGDELIQSISSLTNQNLLANGKMVVEHHKTIKIQ